MVPIVAYVTLLLAICLAPLLVVPDGASADSRAPIKIGGNWGFTEGNGVTGGSGTSSDPYVIEGWEIDLSWVLTDMNSIEIRNTDAHFIIRNVYVQAAGEGVGILLDSVVNGRIENATATGNYGIEVSHSDSVAIAGSTVSNCRDYGMHIYSHSSNISVTDNTVMYNLHGLGVSLSARLTVADNNVTNNEYYGITIGYSSEIVIARNDVEGNRHGIRFHGSANAVVAGNMISSNSVHGVELENSEGVVLHHNIINNTNQAYVDNGEENSWDGGYPTGGNYWTDYTGSDQFSGPDQNQAGSDGIGDTSYIIDDDSQDRYPLMVPQPPASVPPIASFTVSPAEGDTSTVFTANASLSWDLEDPEDILEVRWDWEDDGTWDTAWSTTKSAQHKYGEPDTYTIRLEVRDSGGATNTATTRINVEPEPPPLGLSSESWMGIAIIVATAVILVVFFFLARGESFIARRLLRNWKVSSFCAILAFILVLLALFGPWYRYNEVNYDPEGEYLAQLDMPYTLREYTYRWNWKGTTTQDRTTTYSEVSEAYPNLDLPSIDVFNTTQLLTILALIFASLMLVFAVLVGRGKLSSKFGTIIGLLATIFALTALVYFMVALPGAMEEEEGLLESPSISGFWGTDTRTRPVMGETWLAELHLTWGPEWSWYLMIAAFVILLIGTTMLFGAKREKSWEAALERGEEAPEGSADLQAIEEGVVEGERG